MNAFNRGSLPALLAVVTLLCACTKAPAPPTVTPSPYAAIARGRIDVEGGLFSVVTPIDGRIARVLVKEGQHVKRGEPLVELDSTSARLEVAAAEAGQREARAVLKSLAAQLAAARTRAERLRAAAQAGAGEGQLADDATAQVEQLAAQREVLMAQAAAAETKLEGVRHALALHTLAAPRDAQVTQVIVQAGTQASPGAGALLVLLPDGPRIVRAELSEAYADAVTQDMAARVSPEDDASHSWPAHVLRVSPVEGPARLEDDPQRRGVERTVDCVLALDGQTPLRIGQRVLVRITAPGNAAKD